MVEAGYSPGTLNHYERMLNHFLTFITTHKIDRDSVFTSTTLKAFEEKCELTQSAGAVRGLARYLHGQNKLCAPIQEPEPDLPAIYREYLLYYRKTRQVGPDRAYRVRRVLTALWRYLEKENIDLSALGIDQLDGFLMSVRNLSVAARRPVPYTGYTGHVCADL